MSEILRATGKALSLLFSGEPALWDIIGISFSVSLRAILVSAPLAVLLAFVLTVARFPGRRALISTFNSLMAVSAVVVAFAYDQLLTRMPGADSEQFIDLVLILTGAVMLLMAVLRLGRFIRYVPKVVVSGFMNGIAIGTSTTTTTGFDLKRPVS